MKHQTKAIYKFCHKTFIYFPNFILFMVWFSEISFKRVERLIEEAYDAIYIPANVHNKLVQMFDSLPFAFKIQGKKVCLGILEKNLPLKEYYSIYSINIWHHEKLTKHVEENHKRLKKAIKDKSHPFHAELMSKIGSNYYRYELLLIANLFHDIGIPSTQIIKTHGKYGRIVISKNHDKAGRMIIEEIRDQIYKLFDFDSKEYEYILNFPEAHTYLLYKRFSEDEKLQADVGLSEDDLKNIREAKEKYEEYFNKHSADFYFFAEHDRGRKDKER
ncbi:hypothetical protein ACFL6I_23830 [candidate division KSB1 bacterium]